MEELCVICNRPLGSEETISKHHLIPKSQGGKHSATILIHNICHQKIHSVFTEKQLKQTYNTVKTLTENEEMIKFIKWISKKDPEFYQRNKKMRKK